MANVQAGAIYPYTKSAQIYVCPSSRDGQKTGISCSMNFTLAGPSINCVQSESEVVLLVDEVYPADGFFWASADSSSSDQLTKVNLEGGNLLFCDGHVKLYSYARFNAGENAVDAGAATMKKRTTG